MRLFRFFLVFTLLWGCSAEEEEYIPPFPTASEKYVVFVFYHNLHSGETGIMSEGEYKDSILDIYGDTRTIAFRRSVTDRNRFTHEIPTFTPSISTVNDCWDYQGFNVELEEGDWVLVDLEYEERIVGFFTALDYGQQCEPYWVPFPN